MSGGGVRRARRSKEKLDSLVELRGAARRAEVSEWLRQTEARERAERGLGPPIMDHGGSVHAVPVPAWSFRPLLPGEWREVESGVPVLRPDAEAGGDLVMRRHRLHSRGQRMRVLAEVSGFWDMVQREGGGRFAGRRPYLSMSDVTVGMDVSGVT